MSSGAKDNFGNKIFSDYVSSFNTISFNVDNFYPYNNYQTNIDDQISVNFTGPIDSNSVRQAFQISPNTQGVFTMFPSSFVFSPTNDFAENTNYTVTIKSSVRSRDGVTLPSDYTTSFRTDAFQYTSTFPYNYNYNQNGILRNTSIGMSFNNRIDTNTVRNAFSIVPNAGGGSFDFTNNPTSFYFQPDSLLAPYTNYTVTVSTALKTKGGTSLRNPQSFSFTTGP